jgi:hypothetical protein
MRLFAPPSTGSGYGKLRSIREPFCPPRICAVVAAQATKNWEAHNITLFVANL